MSEYEMVLPFVCVATKGGPYDDPSFVAGFACGALMAKLADALVVDTFETLYEELAEQVDLIAMHHGFKSEVVGRADGWAHYRLRRP